MLNFPDDLCLFFCRVSIVSDLREVHFWLQLILNRAEWLTLLARAGSPLPATRHNQVLRLGSSVGRAED
jgi:hypothetical protein